MPGKGLPGFGHRFMAAMIGLDIAVTLNATLRLSDDYWDQVSDS